jgi:hypothetical protein
VNTPHVVPHLVRERVAGRRRPELTCSILHLQVRRQHETRVGGSGRRGERTDHARRERK